MARKCLPQLGMEPTSSKPKVRHAIELRSQAQNEFYGQLCDDLCGIKQCTHTLSPLLPDYGSNMNTFFKKEGHYNPLDTSIGPSMI